MTASTKAFELLRPPPANEATAPEERPGILWGQGTPAAIAPFTTYNKGSLYMEVNAIDDVPCVWMKVDEGGDAADWVKFASTVMGQSGAPEASATADKKFIEWRAQSTATSGDNRLAYLRFDLDGAGASGECLRAFTDLGAAAATARGAHISLQAGATGYITGLGAGADVQLFIQNEVLAGGTYTALNAEIYSNGSTTAVSGVTSLSFIRCVAGGDSTGAGRVDDKANLITLTGGANGSGNIVGAVGNEPTWASATYLIRCNLNGTSIGLVGVAL